jgi:biotin synthase
MHNHAPVLAPVIEQAYQAACAGLVPDTDCLDQLIALPSSALPGLFAAASQIRQRHFGDTVALCGIVNAKSGLCPEDCAFCAQSSHHHTGVASYPLLSDEAIIDGARRAAAAGAACYGIVTSGTGITSGEELDRLCLVIRQIVDQGIVAPGASLGTLTPAAAEQLQQAGLVTYHHNLETSRSFFPSICTTHAYDDDVATVRCAKEAGLRVCCGGLFGLGESMAQRLELALTLRELQVDSVPLNFLDPVPGTPLANIPSLDPLTCLQTIALFRLLLPTAHITVCGGRQRNLRELQSWVLLAGASGVMTGDYLTKEGRSPEDDRQMVVDQGLVLIKEMVR